MWKIKDPELKAKVNAFFSDEEINNAFAKNTDCYKYFRLSTNINKSSFTFLIDKDLMKFIPDYDPDDWNPYPAAKPSASGLYLITVKLKDQPDAKPFVTVGCLDPFGYWEKYTDSEVLAFRELPEAYEKEKEK